MLRIIHVNSSIIAESAPPTQLRSSRLRHRKTREEIMTRSLSCVQIGSTSDTFLRRTWPHRPNADCSFAMEYKVGLCPPLQLLKTSSLIWCSRGSTKSSLAARRILMFDASVWSTPTDLSFAAADLDSAFEWLLFFNKKIPLYWIYFFIAMCRLILNIFRFN